MSQQDLTEAVPISSAVFDRILSRSDQVTQRFLLLVGNVDRRQRSRTIEKHELLGIPSIRLHTVPCLSRRQRRSRDRAKDAFLDQPSLQDEAARACLVDAANLSLVGFELLDQLPQSLFVRYDFEPLVDPLFIVDRDRPDHFAGVIVESNSAYISIYRCTILHDPFLLDVGLHPRRRKSRTACASGGSPIS